MLCDKPGTNDQDSNDRCGSQHSCPQDGETEDHSSRKIDVEELEKRMRAAEDQAAEHLDRLMRTQADFQNYKKRAEKNREQMKQRERLETVRNFLPVYDNLGRVLDATDEDAGPVRDGVVMILRQIEQVLQHMGISRVPTEGENFDPRRHEAVEHVPTDEHPEGTITGEFQAGFIINDVLVRPARVRVAKAATSTCCQANNDGDE